MRSLAIVTVVGAMTVGVVAFCWESPKHPSGDRVPGCVTTDPHVEVAAVDARIRAKRELALQIVTQRIPLLEAAELFRETNGPCGMRDLSGVLLGESLHEKLCRQVIVYAATCEAELEQSGQMPAGPSHVASLREELQRRLAAGELKSDQTVE